MSTDDISTSTDAGPSSPFPPQTRAYILAFQFSSWYSNPSLAALSIKSTVVRPLPSGVREYLNSDAGLFVPEGADDAPAESELSDDEEGALPDESDEESGDDSDGEAPSKPPRYAFPELDAKIRACIKEYGAVFPKLNFSAPKDATWVLNPSEPLKCTSPADVYFALKASDFCMHDLSVEHVFGTDSSGPGEHDTADTEDSDKVKEPYELELVLRKWYSIEVSRELRCFVRGNALIGISQRDMNYYDFYNEPATRDGLLDTIYRWWEKNVKQHWELMRDYTFDILLTRDLSRAHIIDFNPYAPRTDTLLFTYEELHDIYTTRFSQSRPDAPSSPTESTTSASPSASSSSIAPPLPIFRVIDSRAHPAATQGAPAYMHNKVPLDVLTMSSGRDVTEFTDAWYREVQKSAQAQAAGDQGNNAR
ncbi:hypothetical protein HGRIS_005725 [Hohenbuehelia grisea]|uniref:Cell division cycle protein 123 n=1 Tax=Hohenbuehelia grisea TaxID=104357 RepID=A0ABR3JZS9_9AGAR